MTWAIHLGKVGVLSDLPNESSLELRLKTAEIDALRALATREDGRGRRLFWEGSSNQCATGHVVKADI